MKKLLIIFGLLVMVFVHSTFADRYVDNGDGTVTDNATGLMWTKNANLFEKLVWDEAVAACANVTNTPYYDWWLPTVDNEGGAAELDTLGRVNGNPNGVWEGFAGTPFINVQTGDYEYWSSTVNVGAPDYAYHVWMVDGRVALAIPKTTPLYVWPVRRPVPLQATTPSPTNGAINQETNITLSWINGGFATNYNVNFGTSNNMTTKGSQAGTTYTPTNMIYYTNYQWRIDSVNAQGMITGNVWNFSTKNLFKAINPVPADNTLDVSLSGTNLQWQGGGGETNFTVYFGLLGGMSNAYSGTGTNYVTGALEKGKTYTWRVDSQNASASVTGDTWTFYSLFIVIAHKIMGVVDNVNVFGRQGNRIWGK